MQAHNKKISPIAAVAVNSIITFSVVGVGIITGIIPSPFPKSVNAPAPAAEPQAVPPVLRVAIGQVSPVTTLKREPAHLASAGPAPRVAATPPLRPGICANCGSVVSIDVTSHDGEGRVRTTATVVGIAGGAYADHEIEKHANGANSYNVAVRMDDGSSRSFDYDAMPGYRAGDKVKVVEGRLVSR